MNEWASQRGVCILHQRLGNRGTGLQCLRGVWVTLFVFVCLPIFKNRKNVLSKLGFTHSLKNSGMGPHWASVST